MTNISLDLGCMKHGKIIKWPFNHKALPNRHYLSLGMSGQGKTYKIQHLLKQATEQGLSGIIFDYSGSYTDEKLEPGFLTSSQINISQINIYTDGININPFKYQEILINGEICNEKATDIADRVSDTLKANLHLTIKQQSDIYKASMFALNGDLSFCNDDEMEAKIYRKYLNFNSSDSLIADFYSLRYFLAKMPTDSANSALCKITSLIDKNIFKGGSDFKWGDYIYTPGKVTILQMSNFSPQLRKLITEFLLYDLWFYTTKNGSEAKPFIVVLDECQNLSFGESSPASLVLTEGRKFGWSAWFSTQFLGGIFKKDAINRLQQAALQINFKSTAEENLRTAKVYDRNNIKKWIEIIETLQKGECICYGHFETYGGQLSPPTPVKVRIPAL